MRYRQDGGFDVLEVFRAVAESDGGSVTLVLTIGRALPPGCAAQADALRESLLAAGRQSQVARLPGLDTAVGQVQLGLGVGGLLVSGLAAAVSMSLPAGRGSRGGGGTASVRSRGCSCFRSSPDPVEESGADGSEHEIPGNE